MALNSDYYRHIKSVLGDEELSQNLSENEVLRHAADWLSGEHPWAFLIRPIRLALRGLIDITDALYTDADRTLFKVGAFTAYAFVPGDYFLALDGTGVTLKAYPVESRTDDDTIVLAEDGLGAAANLSADVDGRLPNDRIGLPTDFMHFAGARPLRSVDSVGRGVELVTREQLSQMRSGSAVVEGDAIFYGAVTELVDPGEGDTVPVLELYPIPNTTTPDAFQGYYRAHLVIGDEDRDVVPLPRNRPLLDALLKKACRIFTMGWEEGEEAGNRSLEVMLEDLSSSKFMRAAKKQDGLTQPTLGPMRGGVGHSRYGWRRGLATPVDGPS